MALFRFLVAALIGLALGLWTTTRPGDPDLFPVGPGEVGVTVRLLDNGFHTDLAVPRSLLEAGDDALARAAKGLAPGDWVLVGWGDAVFYVDQSPIRDRLPDGARAFFRPGGNPSVVMLDPTRTDPAAWPDASRRVTLRLSQAGARAMRARIRASLSVDAAGAPIISARRKTDDAVFFCSRERFSIVRLCNHWTAEVLNAAGLSIRPYRSLTSGEVMRAARDAAALDLKPVRD